MALLDRRAFGLLLCIDMQRAGSDIFLYSQLALGKVNWSSQGADV